MNENKAQPTVRIWIAIVLFMLMGSIAGNTESVYLGLFLDNTVFENGPMGASITLTDAVNLIASLGAVISCGTAFFVGTLSEKLKNRKVFISVGYIVWGIVMVTCSVISNENVRNIFGISETARVITISAAMIVGFSLVLSFLRSTTSDTAFNSWVTDVSTPETSTIIEVLFTIMGFVATAIITLLVARAEIDSSMEYSSIFVILGILAIGAGCMGFFLIKEPEKFEKTEKTEVVSQADAFYGLRPSVIKEHSNLYLMLSSGCLFNCACQVFLPYFFIYITSVIIPAPENKELNLRMPVVIILLIMAVTIGLMLVMILMKAYSKHKALSFIPSVICLVIGFLVLSSTKNVFGFVMGFAPAFVGYVIIMIQFGATVRNNIPQDKVGLFQGVRVLFLFLIPKIVGPTLGNIAAKNSNIKYQASNYSEKLLPTEDMFLYSAVIATLIFIPMIAFLIKDHKKSLEEKNELK